MTTLYLCRHSIPFKKHRGIERIRENNLLWNKMSPLSVEGEKSAERLSNYEPLKNIDIVWSSDYVRTMSTAKYIASNNNVKVNVDERLGERIHGIIPENFNYNEYEIRQLVDKQYKLINGENQEDVLNRMLKCIEQIIEENKDKNIFICSHSTAITFLLLNYCKLDLTKKELLFNGKVIFDMNWKMPELFKLIFDENNNLLSIENIRNN